jgi:non-heme Fe2+,alpha-ketoglutarate-dependent halogenase
MRATSERLDALRAGDRWQINTDTHFVLEWVDALTREPGILDAVEKVLGPDLLAWNTSWFVKFPGDKAFVSWHQDGAYWGLSPMEVATAWVALGPVTPENGCMRVIPGSHTRTHLPQRDTFADNNVLSRGQEIAVAVDEAQAVDLALQPGQISLHHLWIVHGSNANRPTNRASGSPSATLRRRYARRGPQADRHAGARAGQHGHFTLTDRPQGNEAVAGEGRHAELLQRVRVALAQAGQPTADSPTGSG